MSRLYYDDNYGVWDNTDEPEVREFYRRTQRRNVRKVCSMCGRTVYIKPEYDKCGRCADMIERGY
jgi:hypothetical protein